MAGLCRRRLRRLVAALSTTVVATTGFATVAPPAQATHCTARADLPARVVVDRAYQAVPAVFRTTCAAPAYASVYLFGPHGMEDVFLYDPARIGAADTWDVYDWVRPGTYRTRDGWGYLQGGVDHPMRMRYEAVSVRFGSRAGIAAVRSGSTVTVTAGGRRYHPGHRRYVPWNALARIDSKAPGGRWTYVKTVDLGADGLASARLSAPTWRYFRVRLGDTAKVWGARTGAVGR